MGKPIRYQDENIDLYLLIKEIEMWFRERRYKVEIKEAEGRWCIKARKLHLLRKAMGAARAFDVFIFGDPNNFLIEIRTGAWEENLIGMGITGFITMGFGLVVTIPAVAWSQKLRHDILNMIEEKVLFGKKAISTGRKSAMFAPRSLHSGQSEIETKITQLRSALETGILSLAEYETKLAVLTGETTLNTSQISKEDMLAQLQEALAANILTPEEYKRKRQELALGDQLEDLHKALQHGVLTEREFYKKRAELLELPLPDAP